MTITGPIPLANGRLFLGCLLFALFVATESRNFPGSFSCLDDEILIRKPKGIRLSDWQHLHVVDSAGVPIPHCVHFIDGEILEVPYKCSKYKMGKHLLHIQFRKGKDTFQYRIICNDMQADEGAEELVVQCGPHSMLAKVSRKLHSFDDEVLTAPIDSSWSLEIKDRGQVSRLNVNQAKQRGYIMTSDEQYLIIQAYYNASGIKEFTREGQKLYLADIRLILRSGIATITVVNPMICITGPPVCNTTHMTLVVPPFGSELVAATFNDVNIPVRPFAQELYGVTVEPTNGLRNGYKLYIKREIVKNNKGFLKLAFNHDGTNVPMLLAAACPDVSNPTRAQCTPDGYMNVEVVKTQTSPTLNLSTVRLRDGTCKPSLVTESKLLFSLSLNSCGTTVRSVGNKLLYENEIHALWKDFPPRRISRDSEYRLTIQCYYSADDDKNLLVNVITPPPLASSKNDGPLSLVLNLFPDDSYASPYTEIQYPVVKTLREPIYLEVQVLNRNDPNIELVLDDCWATMSSNPHEFPQWNVVVDGCAEERDNFQTVFHPVGTNVAQPSHRKRFEVKTFSFVLGGEVSTNLIYFHCSAIVCNKLEPDFPLCSKTCQRTRMRRDDLFIHEDPSLVSLPGPLLFVDSETSMQEKAYIVKEYLTIQVLSILGILAVIIILAVVFLFSFKRKSKSVAH